LVSLLVLVHPFHIFVRAVFAVSCLSLLTSCSSHDLPAARHAFYQGQYEQSEEAIGTEAVDGKDSVLILMERGAIYQAEGKYEQSSMDFILAGDILDLLQTYSLSEGAASWVTNDTVYSFEGTPFERTLLNSMTALNHLAMDNWEDGGVEARRIIHSLADEQRGEEYPKDAFSRYLAAFILEQTGDFSNAKMQYQQANELRPDLQIDEKGLIYEEENSPEILPNRQELICFFLIGRSPTIRELQGEFSNSIYPPRIQLHANGKLLGHASILSSVRNLALLTWNLEAPARIAKMAARIAAKEAMARSLEDQDAALGALARIILIGMLEQPDFRRWETLPRWLGVARVPCPVELSTFDVTIQGEGNIVGESITVQQPIVQHGNIYFSFVRDLPGFNSKKIKKEIDK
jgi:hypothetical protein